MDLPIRILTEGCDPSRAHASDAGLDLRAAEAFILGPGERRMVPAGVAVAIPDGHVGLVAPRSGLGAKYGVTLANSVGVIDAGYRGELKMPLVNHGDGKVEFQRGDRIAQLLIMPIALPDVRVVDELPDGDRGHGGFGSTGTA